MWRIPRRLYRWYDDPAYARRRRTLVYLLVTLAWGLSLFRIEHNYEQDTRRSCKDRQGGRLVLREVIVAATAGSGGTDYTKIPSFADLDPETQKFLTDLRTASASGGSQSEAFRKRLLDRAPPVVCKGDPVPGGAPV